MDAWARAIDNIFVERLWRTVKYEDIYLKNCETVSDLVIGLDKYFRFYTQERLKQCLAYAHRLKFILLK